MPPSALELNLVSSRLAKGWQAGLLLLAVLVGLLAAPVGQVVIGLLWLGHALIQRWQLRHQVRQLRIEADRCYLAGQPARLRASQQTPWLLSLDFELQAGGKRRVRVWADALSAEHWSALRAWVRTQSLN